MEPDEKFDWALAFGVLVLSLFGTGIIYLVCAFTAWSLHPGDWHELARAVAASASVIFTILVCIAAYGDEE